MCFKCWTTFGWASIAFPFSHFGWANPKAPLVSRSKITLKLLLKCLFDLKRILLTCEGSLLTICFFDGIRGARKINTTFRKKKKRKIFLLEFQVFPHLILYNVVLKSALYGMVIQVQPESSWWKFMKNCYRNIKKFFCSISHIPIIYKWKILKYWSWECSSSSMFLLMVLSELEKALTISLFFSLAIVT